MLTYLLRFLLVAACAMGISAVSELPLSFDDKGNVGKSVYILRVGSYAVSAGESGLATTMFQTLFPILVLHRSAPLALPFYSLATPLLLLCVLVFTFPSSLLPCVGG